MLYDLFCLLVVPMSEETFQYMLLTLLVVVAFVSFVATTDR